MGKTCFLMVLLILALLTLSFTQGFGRKEMAFMKDKETSVHLQEKSDKGREMVELMDYDDPGPNTNPRTYQLSPPPAGFP